MTIITPSKPDYWRGTNTGGKYTVEQLNVLGRRPSEFAAAHFRGVPSSYVVRKLAEPKTLQDLPREVQFTCPALAVSKDMKRILVITPSGLEQWVDMK